MFVAFLLCLILIVGLVFGSCITTVRARIARRYNPWRDS